MLSVEASVIFEGLYMGIEIIFSIIRSKKNGVDC